MCREESVDPVVALCGDEHLFCRGCLKAFQDLARRHERSPACPACQRRRSRANLGIDTALVALAVAQKYGKFTSYDENKKHEGLPWLTYWCVYAAEKLNEVAQSFEAETRFSVVQVKLDAFCINGLFPVAYDFYNNTLKGEITASNDYGRFREVPFLDHWGDVTRIQTGDLGSIVHFMAKGADVLSRYSHISAANPEEVLVFCYDRAFNICQSDEFDRSAEEKAYLTSLLLKGKCRLLHELKHFGVAVQTGLQALHSARYSPGVHKYLSLSYSALEETECAGLSDQLSEEHEISEQTYGKIMVHDEHGDLLKNDSTADECDSCALLSDMPPNVHDKAYNEQCNLFQKMSTTSHAEYKRRTEGTA